MADTTHTCPYCTERAIANHGASRTCGTPECKAANERATKRAYTRRRQMSDPQYGKTRWGTCERCGTPFPVRPATSQRFCSRACTYPAKPPAPPNPRRDQRSPMRRAWEEADHPTFLAAINERTTRTDTGCHIWTGRIKDGYPVVGWNEAGRKVIRYVHRMVLEAHNRAPLGVDTAHHTCANSQCVNPEHLQLISARENVAEMLQRTYYQARIAELESALREIAPTHRALHRAHLAPAEPGMVDG